MIYVLVTESNYPGCVPSVERFVLKRQNRHSIVVAVYDREKTILSAAGRKWFTDEAEFRSWFKRTCEHQAKCAEARARELREVADQPAVRVVPHTHPAQGTPHGDPTAEC